MGARSRFPVTYVNVLRLPRALRAFVPSIIGKFSFAMVSLSLLLLVQERGGSYAVSGAVAGAFGLANVAVSPLRARMVDRLGGQRVLICLSLGYAIGLTGVVFAVDLGLSAPVLIALGALAGLFPPPLGAVMRGHWAQLSPTDHHRSRAYSLDAVVEELIFVVGPLLASGALLLPHGPEIGVAVAAGAGLLGTLGMASAGIPAIVHERTPRRGKAAWVGPLGRPGLWPVLAILVAVGVVLGSVEVLSTARANIAGSPELAGLFIACASLGSATGGLLYGARTWHRSQQARLFILGTGMCAAMVVVAIVDGVPAQLALFAVVGTFMAPTMVTGYLLADELAPPSERTEASALINTAVNLGAAVALALAGLLLDSMSIVGTTLTVTAIATGFIGVAGVAARSHRGIGKEASTMQSARRD